MGYIILATQLDAINRITNNASVSIRSIDNIDLLWLPGYIRMTVWDNKGQHSGYEINEDGEVTVLHT